MAAGRTPAGRRNRSRLPRPTARRIRRRSPGSGRWWHQGFRSAAASRPDDPSGRRSFCPPGQARGQALSRRLLVRGGFFSPSPCLRWGQATGGRLAAVAAVQPELTFQFRDARPQFRYQRLLCGDNRFRRRRAGWCRGGCFRRIQIRWRRHWELESCRDSRVKCRSTVCYLGSYGQPRVGSSERGGRVNAWAMSGCYRHRDLTIYQRRQPPPRQPQPPPITTSGPYAYG